MKNAENLTNADAQVSLEILQESTEKLALAYHSKNSLESCIKARVELEIWCKLADMSDLRPQKEGVSAYWKDGVISAKVEGFNWKIRWLIKQAYGYQYEGYFEFKVFDLPKMKITKDL